MTMLDRYIRRLIDPPLKAMARILVKWNITANTLTGIGFIFSLAVFTALAFQLYTFAVAFIILSRVMDGLDGPVARQSHATDIGGFFDIVSDFIFYSGTVFFFAVGRPDAALPAAFLIFSFVGTGSSFLTYAIFAAKRGMETDDQGEKSFFYLSGITEGTESIFVLVLICLIPAYFPWIAYSFGILCWVTTFGRTMQAVKAFKE